MTLLTHPLIQKYFRHCQLSWCHCDVWTDSIAGAVIEAMQQPVQKGERYLKCYSQTLSPLNITEFECIDDKLKDYIWHPDVLRLPNAFQKQEIIESDYLCEVCHRMASKHIACEIPHKPAPTTEKCECHINKCGICGKQK